MNPMGTRVLASLALALCLILSQHACAATVTYDFTGMGTSSLGTGAVPMTVDGLTVNINALDETGSSTGELVQNNQTGLGVATDPAASLVGADSTGAEAIVFDFSPQAVSILESVIFETDSNSGSFDVYAGNDYLETVSWDETAGAGTSTGDSFVTHTFISNAVDRIAQTFTFKAVEDGFRIASLAVQRVPEPGSLVLLLVAVGSVSLTAKRSGR